MVFDFGRCLYNPKNWIIEGYYFNRNKITEKEFLMKNPIPKSPEEKDRMMMSLCDYYSILKFYFEDCTVNIRIYDKDVEMVRDSIINAVKENQNYIEIDIEHFYDDTKNIEFRNYVNGGVTAYSA